MSDILQTIFCALVAFLVGAVWTAVQHDKVTRKECDKFGFVKLIDDYYNCEKRP